jgi:hypothetical protein
MDRAIRIEIAPTRPSPVFNERSTDYAAMMGRVGTPVAQHPGLIKNAGRHIPSYLLYPASVPSAVRRNAPPANPVMAVIAHSVGYHTRIAFVTATEKYQFLRMTRYEYSDQPSPHIFACMRVMWGTMNQVPL